ncbi:uncharacterized protein KIAA2012 homolog isoform X2 [Stegostoma tigrinum]|uniref:uncharacterized protein KIAA2012 homolog isoform X2 n=1 Tax=Stegostoma tigrinum TaxID=3053191 RepID=UPI0028706434|nr:uncharacterized protein KIAA2012 homolog isoform X2 [Stegostoma tigrinum]
MWNFSLLSRGCGELVNRKHERLDVYFEAQDYFNWKSPRNSTFVSLKLCDSEGFLHHDSQPVPPKTFSTRRGALVLYSEDLALQSWQHQRNVKWQRRVRVRLSTLQDLARAVLAYGQRENGTGPMQVEPYLHFLIGHRNHPGNRKIRPGYSAKRYLACLAETCNLTLLHRLQRSDCTNKLNWLQGLSMDSLLQQETKCDMSKAPRPYRAIPCLPVADLYQSWPCLEEEEEEHGEEIIDDTDECCPITDNEIRGMQSDSSRPGVAERLTNRERGAEGSDPQETSLYVLVTLPARDLELITEEADQVQATQQVSDKPPPSFLNRRQPAEAEDQRHSDSLLGQPTIDSSQLCCQKSRATYYGGPLAGVRRVKSRPGDQYGSRHHVQPPAFVSGQTKLPPIGSETAAGLQPKQEEGSSKLGRWKWPQIRRRSVAAERHAGRQRKGSIPEAARYSRRLALPPLTDLRPQREKGEDIHNEATGKLEAPDSTETSTMEGLDEFTQINEEYPVSTEDRSSQNGGKAGISEKTSQKESEERQLEFIRIRIEENGNLLGEMKGMSEAPDSMENSKMEVLYQSTQINEEYPIITEERSGWNGGNVGISEKNSQREREVESIGIRIQEDENLLEGGTNQSQKPGRTLQLLPPIHETRGPVGKRRSKPDLRHKARRTKSSLGAVRGTVPKELKDIHKDISVGSLLMAPDGEIVHLSWLGPFQSPSSNLMISFPQQQGHFLPESVVSGKEARLITNQEPEGEVVNTKHLEDFHIETGDDIVYKSNRESGQAPGSYKRSKRRHARKAFRQGGQRRTDPGGDSSGTSESRSSRRGVNSQLPEAPASLQEDMLDENGHLNPPGSHRNPVFDSFLEGEVMRNRKHAALGTGYESSTVIPSLTGWSELETSSPSAAEELEAMCGLHTVDDGHSPSHHRSRRLLAKDGHMVAGDSETEAEDQEAELRNDLGKGSTGIKAKKKSKRNKGQKSPNQDPNAKDGNLVPSSSEGLKTPQEPSHKTGLRSSLVSNQALGLNEPLESRNPVGQDQESGSKVPPGPRGSLGSFPSSGLNNERTRNNGRAEFVVGRPREKRAQQQQYSSRAKQKESSKPVMRRTVTGDGEEEDAEHSSEEGGSLHSIRTRNTPISGSTVTAFTADQDPNSHFNNTTVRDQVKDQEDSDYSQENTHLPESKHLRRSGSSRVKGGDRPQRRQEMERRIQQELDDNQRRKEQEIRKQRQQHEREITQQLEAEHSRQEQEQREQRRQHRQQEEYRRKVQEMQQRKERSLAERAEEAKRLQRERQKEQEEEEELLKAMDETQRTEYLRLKQIKEEREKKEMEEQRREEEERSKFLMQEAMQEAMFLLHQKGLIERDLTFSRNLWVEFLGLERDQNITRPWVFSYFELINFLGLLTPMEEGKEESSHVGQWD